MTQRSSMLARQARRAFFRSLLINSDPVSINPGDAVRAANSSRLILLTFIYFLVWACSSEEPIDPDDAGPASDVDGEEVSVLDTGASDADDTSTDEDINDAQQSPDTGDTDTGDVSDAGDGTDECALAAPFDVDVDYEQEIYVATDGDDEGGDGTAENPFATLNAAAQTASPGTKIVMGPGTYEGGMWIGSLQGEEDQPIAIVADGEVIIEGGTNGIQFSEPRYLVIEGLTLQGATTNGLNIDDGGSFDTPAEFVVLRNLTVRDVGTGGNNDCIKLSGLRNFFILDSEITGCDRGEGIDMVGCHEGIISGNRLGEMPGPGIQAKGGSSDISIHGNWLWDIEGRGINAGGSTGLDFFRPPDADSEAARIEMVSNVLIDIGEESGAPVAFVGCDTCLFAHNTVVNPRSWVARILQESTDDRFVPAREGRFVNNIVALHVDDLRFEVYVNYSDGTDLESFTFGWNLWYAFDRGEDYAGPSYDGGIPPEQDSVIQQDPSFVDFDEQDFRLQPDSPAQGIGTALDEGPFPDFDGHCFSDPPSAGAYSP